MACVEVCKEEKLKEREYSKDGSIDWHGRPAIKAKSGKWTAGTIILLNQGLATLAFFGVGVNLVLFLTRVLGQNNADAANNVSKWTGTVYIFALVGAFLSDSYWGRYKTCAIFQLVFVIGLVSLSLSTYLFLIAPKGCGNQELPCGSHSSLEITLFYLSIYLVALGNGGYQPNIATFGADQFDEEDPKEGHSKVAFFSYFYLALNLGSLLSNTILGYFEDEGMWALGFWVSTGSALAALVLFLAGTTRYRHFKPSGNPLSRFSQVLIAAIRKCSVDTPPDADELYDVDGNDSSMNGIRKILHTEEFKFLDRAAYISTGDVDEQKKGIQSTWRLCPVTQVEEVKCMLRLLPIWLCTIIYSVVFTQMASLFVEQGSAMKTTVSSFRIPPASMSSFDILSVALFIFLYRRVLDPLAASIRKKGSRGLTELQRMGIGLVIAVLAMVSAAIVECYRLKSIRSFMYVGQLEFFNAQTPDGLKSFGSALCMTSISLGNYVSSLLVTMVMKISTEDHMPGWIPGNLNKGHLDRFYFLLAGLTSLDLIVYIACARWYKNIKLEGKTAENIDDQSSFKL
ncbi:Protein NRT1/ PTR FAMILY 7.3 [Hibiscus syriacus]|uniref:Protein NRT1/ PTR FAMILY 7.3 n=1 Tax=Hibiscus syriacus TaxID=106335 RepID=A0A6A2XS57_HIBSY|nr:Protein NRT1/ PTR FAMILY 7.3 [Hibiscus syriacus]